MVRAERKYLRAEEAMLRGRRVRSSAMREWLGLQDRRSAGLFLMATGCSVVFVSLAMVRRGVTRGHLLALAGLACWICSTSMGRRWRFFTKTPAQIAADIRRNGVPFGFAERLLLRLSMVFFALSVYSDFVA
jgi:hypothetical protein